MSRVGGYLCLEALHQNGDKQVKEYVVAKRHEGNEVKGSPRRCGGHAVVEDFIPVLLSQNLWAGDRSQGLTACPTSPAHPCPMTLEPERQ